MEWRVARVWVTDCTVTRQIPKQVKVTRRWIPTPRTTLYFVIWICISTCWYVTLWSRIKYTNFADLLSLTVLHIFGSFPTGDEIIPYLFLLSGSIPEYHCGFGFKINEINYVSGTFSSSAHSPNCRATETIVIKHSK